MPKQTDKRNFGKTETNLPKLDLSLVQRESWLEFLQKGIVEELSEISPIDDFTGKNWQIILENPSLGISKLTPRQTQQKGLTYSIPLKISATLINKKTNERKQQEVFLCDLPQMTSRGTFIINGVERVVINQVVRSPGVYFSGELDTSTGRMLYKAEVRPLRGSWLEFEVDKNDGDERRDKQEIINQIVRYALKIKPSRERQKARQQFHGKVPKRNRGTAVPALSLQQ